jgi:hypothetical protein
MLQITRVEAKPGNCVRREMFSALREKLSGAEQGATCITF